MFVTMITTAFTCTGPYAILIMLGIKRVENRSAMPVPAKGRCAVECSKSFCKEEYGNFVQWASRTLPPEDFERSPAWGDVKDWPGKIASAEDAASLFRAVIPLAGDREGFFVLPLDAEKHVLANPVLVSLGHEDGTTAIDAGAIFREALKVGAEEIIVAHNHPSGDLTPSKADIAATAKLREEGEMLGVPLVDHLILGTASSDDRLGFISLAEYKGRQ